MRDGESVSLIPSLFVSLHFVLSLVPEGLELYLCKSIILGVTKLQNERQKKWEAPKQTFWKSRLEQATLSGLSLGTEDQNNKTSFGFSKWTVHIIIIKLKCFETYLAKIRGAFGQAVAGPVGLHVTV